MATRDAAHDHGVTMGHVTGRAPAHRQSAGPARMLASIAAQCRIALGAGLA
jgi:hypothetical protein